MTRSRGLRLGGYVHCYRTWVCHLSVVSLTNRELTHPNLCRPLFSCNFGSEEGKYTTLCATSGCGASRQVGGQGRPVSPLQIGGLGRSELPHWPDFSPAAKPAWGLHVKPEQAYRMKLRLSPPHCDWSACLHQHFFCTCIFNPTRPFFYAE